MNKKCVGCGALLQDTDISLDGYTSNIDNKLCERCFKIKNYGEYKNVIKDNNNFINILKSINENDLVILVMDLLNLPKDLSLIKENIKSNILVVLTKRDILPKVLYEEKLLNYIDNYKISYVDKIIVSSNKNYNFDNLIDKIKKYNKTKKVYVVGYTNAGKSTLINKIIYNYSDNKPEITTSMLPSTTLNSIEIKFDDNTTFIDTPGLLNEGSIENYVDVNMLKNINPKNSIKPITYQIKSRQYIVMENILKLEVSNNDINIFVSNNLKIDRFYKDKDIKDLVYEEVLVNNSEDLVIPGLGFIKFNKRETVRIAILPNVKVYTRKSLI
ncbi:MAG TPA: 50S ribosome-binding GTPase [Bacilli bacterium]|nr:50S ribosome-binding GTPase [Bacilli bacterium]